MAYINEGDITSQFSLGEVIDERVVSVEVTSETHTPEHTTNDSYDLVEAIDTSLSYACTPSRNVNFTSGNPASNADVFISPTNGRVHHHPDDSGIEFSWDYWGRGSHARALEMNQKRTTIMENFRVGCAGAAYIQAGTKKVDFIKLNAMIGGKLVTWDGSYADLGLNGNCEFPDTTSGKWRAGAIWLKRTSETSATGVLSATWSDEAANQAACGDPVSMEKALCLGVVYAQSAGSGAGNCNNIADSQVRRISRESSHFADLGDGGGVLPSQLVNCDATVQTGDTVTWYKDANGYSKENSTLKKANSTNTPQGDPDINLTSMPVVGIAGDKPDGSSGTTCYLIRYGTNISINCDEDGQNGHSYWQALSDPGKITGVKPFAVGDWAQHVAYGSDDPNRFRIAMGPLWQAVYDPPPPPPPDPIEPPRPDGTLPKPPGTGTIFANISLTSATYDLVYIHHWTDYYAVMYRAQANNPTNCPTPYISIGPNGIEHADPPPEGGIYGIVTQFWKEYNSTYKTVVVTMLPISTSRLIPIDSAGQANCSWGSDGERVYVSPDNAGEMTKTRPTGYRQVAFNTGYDTGGFIPLDPGGNATPFWGKVGLWEINDYEIDPEPEGLWVRCDPNVTVDDWVGLCPSAVDRTRYVKAYNSIVDWYPIGASAVVTHKDPNNASLCKILSSGYHHFGLGNYSINASSRYFLSNDSGEMSNSPPALTSIEQLPTMFTQTLGYGINPTSSDPNAKNFRIDIQNMIPTIYEMSGNRNQKYFITINDKSDSGTQMDSDQTLYWHTGGSKVVITSIQIGNLENSGNESNGGSLSLSAWDVNNDTELFRIQPNISANATANSNTYIDNGSITAGVLNLTNSANVSGLVKLTISLNGTYSHGNNPYNAMIQIGYIPVA